VVFTEIQKKNYQRKHTHHQPSHTRAKADDTGGGQKNQISTKKVTMITKKKVIKRLRWIVVGLFVSMNIIAYFHAYKFTHFSESNAEKTKNPKELGVLNKVKTLLFGINNPKPINKTSPNRPFETLYLQSSKKIEGWHIKVDSSKGTVLIFHGFSGNKSLMLDKSDEFNKLGYSTLLVDFVGTGGSEGNETTIGYKEAQDVKICIDYLKQTNEKNIILFGTSMGAAAILRAAEQFNINPTSAILECPFGSMYKTTCARFKQMNVPCFPMAGLLVFWGGVQNGFCAFAHNPENYAKKVSFPTLLLYGEKDAEVSRAEIDNIFANINTTKHLHTFVDAGHENYLKRYKDDWIKGVSLFLNENVPNNQ
jgi:pimeloyl-ACP methyl ester carboxylesterase